MRELPDGLAVWESLNWPDSLEHFVAEVERRFMRFGEAVDAISRTLWQRDKRVLTTDERAALVLLFARRSLGRWQ